MCKIVTFRGNLSTIFLKVLNIYLFSTIFRKVEIVMLRCNFFTIFDKHFLIMFQLQWNIGNIPDIFLQYSVLYGTLALTNDLLSQIRDISYFRIIQPPLSTLGRQTLWLTLLGYPLLWNFFHLFPLLRLNVVSPLVFTAAPLLGMWPTRERFRLPLCLYTLAQKIPEVWKSPCGMYVPLYVLIMP